jgi:hypothetical protein
MNANKRNLTRDWKHKLEGRLKANRWAGRNSEKGRKGLVRFTTNLLPIQARLSEKKTKKINEWCCTVRALPRWSPTRVLDTPMAA